MVEKTICTRILAKDCGMATMVHRRRGGFNPFRVGVRGLGLTQGSSCLATLG